MHAVEVMDRPDASSQRVRIGDRGGYVGLGQQNRLRQAPAARQVAGHRGGERAAGAMGRIRLLPVGFENFLLRLPFGW